MLLDYTWSIPQKIRKKGEMLLYTYNLQITCGPRQGPIVRVPAPLPLARNWQSDVAKPRSQSPAPNQRPHPSVSVPRAKPSGVPRATDQESMRGKEWAISPQRATEARVLSFQSQKQGHSFVVCGKGKRTAGLMMQKDTSSQK